MVDPFDLFAGWLHETFVIPVLYAFGLMRWEELAQGWVLFAVYGAVQVALTLAICLPLERWRPVEQWPDKRRQNLFDARSRPGRVQHFEPPLVDWLNSPRDHRVDQTFLGLEMVVDGGKVDLRLGGDVAQRRSLETI